MYVITHKLFLLYIPTFQMKMVEDGGKVDWDSVKYHNWYSRIPEATECSWPLAYMNYCDLMKWTVQCFDQHHSILKLLCFLTLSIFQKTLWIYKQYHHLKV
jgi:hypothetical protein